MTHGRYPALRIRRTRLHPWSRALVRETVLTPADIIWPVFVTDGPTEPLATLPSVSRLNLAELPAAARDAQSLGIPAIALFPATDPAKRSDDAAHALDPANLMCRAIDTAKQAAPDLGILADVALDPYTAHGHDGVLDAHGRVDNDATVAILVEQALTQARAGADILAPSDMMDGRIGAIRQALERENYPDVQLMAYAAKYASAFYGPFREAVGSAGVLKGDKRGYQMDPANAEEALREVALDLDEGADTILVKPGLPYLDIIQRIKLRFQVPVFAYQTSGEAAMIEGAARLDALDRDAAILETLTALRRAGASGILTYFASHAARLLGA